MSAAAPALFKKNSPPEFSPLMESIVVVVLSAVMMLPCFWQPRLVAGDLSSHAYNAWLAGEIQEGRAPGLSIVSKWTNVLVDWSLQLLTPVTGSDLATQLVASASVLTFFWGAFFLIHTTSGRRPWMLGPLLAILSYGVVFHLGFLNFYLSAGLCLWILRLLWNPSGRKLWALVPLTALALLAHVLPVIWVAAVALYQYAFRRASPIARIFMPLGSIAGLMVIQQAILARLPASWSWGQTGTLTGFAGLTGIEQAWLYDQKYLLVSAGMLLCVILLFLEEVDKMDFMGDPAVQIWMLHVSAFVLLPATVQLPQYEYHLAFIPQRISLLLAIAFCMMVAKAAYGRGITRLSVVVAVGFFTFLYMDDAALNRAEDQITRVVREAPPGSRVIASLSDAGTRVNALSHVADRACIGYCFSYSNYEPSTGQFRIRLNGDGEGGAAAPTVKSVKEIELGQHIVTAAEAPLYAVCPGEALGSSSLVLRRLGAGERTCASEGVYSVRLLEGLFSRF